MDSRPRRRTPINGPYYQHQLAQIYLLVGEPEKALDQLEPLLKTPYYLSPGWLRLDPTFASLKGNPRYDRLDAGQTRVASSTLLETAYRSARYLIAPAFPTSRRSTPV
jgi:hypothetical protein